MFCVCCDTPTTNENRLATNIMAVIAYTHTHTHHNQSTTHTAMVTTQQWTRRDIIGKCAKKTVSNFSEQQQKIVCSFWMVSFCRVDLLLACVCVWLKHLTSVRKEERDRERTEKISQKISLQTTVGVGAYIYMCVYIHVSHNGITSSSSSFFWKQVAGLSSSSSSSSLSIAFRSKIYLLFYSCAIRSLLSLVYFNWNTQQRETKCERRAGERKKNCWEDEHTGAVFGFLFSLCCCGVTHRSLSLRQSTDQSQGDRGRGGERELRGRHITVLFLTTLITAYK